MTDGRGVRIASAQEPGTTGAGAAAGADGEVGSLRLPAALASAPAARRFAVARLARLHQDDQDTLALLVTEVVTNALLHACSGVLLTLTLRHRGTVLLVQVQDDEPTLPTQRRHGEGAATGRGMLLVDALSSNWGVTQFSGGKTVWFELALTGRGSCR